MNKRVAALQKLPPRRLIIVALLVCVVPLAVPHFVAGSQKRATPPPAIDYANAERAVSVTTPFGAADLVIARAANGWRCVSVVLPDRAAKGENSQSGGQCVPELSALTTGPKLTTTMSWVRARNEVDLVVHGRAAPSIHRVELEMNGRIVPAALSHRAFGYYVSRVSAPAIGKLPGPLAVVGYDLTGRELGRLDLEKVLADATPE